MRLLFLSVLVLLTTVSRSTYASDDQIEIMVKKSITSNTATSNGEWEVDVAWVEITTIFDYTEALRGIVSYSPSKNSRTCENISFIQTAQVLDNEGNDYIWPLGEAPRNQIKTAASFGVNPHYYIDHSASACQERENCSPYYRDYWPNEEDNSQDGFNKDGKQKSAVLVDYPFGWEIISSIKLEACAYCRDSNTPLSCFQWGGKWPLIGEQEFIIGGATEKPTNTFVHALENFHNYYSKKASK